MLLAMKVNYVIQPFKSSYGISMSCCICLATKSNINTKRQLEKVKPLLKAKYSAEVLKSNFNKVMFSESAY